MFARSISVLIVGFWLVMIGLLVRKEIGPAGSALREVPVSHVIKLLLVHGEPSDLNIYNDKFRLGHLGIHPHMHKDTRSRVIDFVGNLQILVPGWDRQSVTWNGEIELEKDLATRRFTINLTQRDPGVPENLALQVQVTVSPPENLLTWSWRLAGREEPPRSCTLDEPGLRKALLENFPDAAAATQMFQSQRKAMSAPVVRALQSSMLIHGERIDTYLITVEQSGQTLLEFDVSQLGNILRAKTLIGYSLAPDDFVP